MHGGYRGFAGDVIKDYVYNLCKYRSDISNLTCILGFSESLSDTEQLILALNFYSFHAATACNEKTVGDREHFYFACVTYSILDTCKKNYFLLGHKNEDSFMILRRC